ncbi:Domain of uncharacterised function (DUF3560) [Bordetella ansorpii]|uniref:Domain of uncharacterized function (DUF3560) n=1 Tax=Bordetella ansorpii TaxID=288768 RepID=A0A157SSL4_9BORD|nr:DUF3560 domain-containing protein [Bordetella ansorpii]SAI73133.1 Domain of uncharacterised function (DUF3560) [Bordetella ansorpii]
MQDLTATYSPEDNKLRLYSLHRVDADLYRRLKDAGFSWAPKQDCFVAPMWTPEREDLLLELCGQIEAETTTVAQRAAQRSERFEDYGERRRQDAETARSRVSAITAHIPMGQPILVGHHSERRARRDAERIEQGIRRAILATDKAAYWDWRALGAERHARQKADPAVRHRRIRTLQAEQRKHQRTLDEAQVRLRMWSVEAVSIEQALRVASVASVSHAFPLADYPRCPPASQYEGLMSLYAALKDGIVDPAQARDIAAAQLQRQIARAQRWRAHVAGRVEYEQAQQDGDTGDLAQQFDVAAGGSVLVGGDWRGVHRVNRSGGCVVSLTIDAPASMHWAKTIKVGIEDVSDYRPPSACDPKQAKAPPIVNYPGEGVLTVTAAQWRDTHRDYKGVHTVEATAEHGAYRCRMLMQHGASHQVYLGDKPRVDRPGPQA